MDIEELKRRAGVLNEQGDFRQKVSEFERHLASLGHRGMTDVEGQKIISDITNHVNRMLSELKMT